MLVIFISADSGIRTPLKAGLYQDLGAIPCPSWCPVSPNHPCFDTLTPPQEICTRPANPLLAGMETGAPGCTAQLRCLTPLNLQPKKYGPQTESREPRRGEDSQRNGPCGHDVDISLHHLNGPMVFCSQGSVALENSN